MAILDKIKNKVVNVVSDAMSAPARANAAASMKQSDQDTADLKMVRAAKGVADKGNYKDPLFQARANVSGIKFNAERVAADAKKRANEAPAAKGNYETEYAKRMSGKPNRF